MAAHIETGTMASPRHYSTRVLHHLGLVAAMVDELGIVEWIDRVLPKDPGKQIFLWPSRQGHAFEWAGI